MNYNEVFRIGRIGKPHGVKGELTMHIDDDVFDRIDADYVVLDVDGILVPFFFDEYRFRTDETLLVKFTDIDTTDEARRLTGCDVYFERRLSPSNEGSTLSWAEMVGFSVYDENSRETVGHVKNFDLSTINTLIEVVTPDGGELLIPVADEIVGHVDVEKRQIIVALPEGLASLNG